MRPVSACCPPRSTATRPASRTRRFTQQDPIGLAGGLNAYGFASGDPVNFGDPFGLCPPEPCAGTARGVFLTLGRWAPEINHEVATFLPRNLLAAAVGEVAGAAAGALRIARATRTFFRGVSEAEAADVAANGVLRSAGEATGNVGKYITDTFESAAEWGTRLNGPGAQVLRITVPADATATFTSLGRIDGIGQAWVAPVHSLKDATVEILQAAKAAR